MPRTNKFEPGLYQFKVSLYLSRFSSKEMMVKYHEDQNAKKSWPIELEESMHIKMETGTIIHVVKQYVTDDLYCQIIGFYVISKYYAGFARVPGFENQYGLFTYLKKLEA